MAFYVSVKELLVRLSFSAAFPVDQVSLVGDQGILVNGPGGVEDRGGRARGSTWEKFPSSPSFVGSLPLTAPGGTTAAYRAFSARLQAPWNNEVACILVPNSRFEMTEFMKGLLLATFFFTVFLLLYLVLNLRSDPMEVLRQRVKRFQVQLITELVGSPGGADWGKWRRELEVRKDEITWQIQRGIGRVSRKKKPVIDEYMTKSWEEILDLISRRVETPPAPAVGGHGFHPPGSPDQDGAPERELHSSRARRRQPPRRGRHARPSRLRPLRRLHPHGRPRPRKALSRYRGWRRATSRRSSKKRRQRGRS